MHENARRRFWGGKGKGKRKGSRENFYNFFKGERIRIGERGEGRQRRGKGKKKASRESF
jgi:hypothetical protein